MTATMPSEVKAVMAQAPYWTNVRQTREQLGKHFREQGAKGEAGPSGNWDPNRPITPNEPWIYVTAIEDGEVNILGSTRRAIRTFESSVEQAACVIASHTHRLATKEEIVSFVKDRRDREEKCRFEEERVNPAVAAQRASVRSTEAITKAVQEMAGRSINENATAGKGRDK